MQEVEFHLIETNGIRLHAAVAGPEDGELVVLLHGFPEFSYGFHHQMEELAASGYRVVVPDQRGYHLSDKPEQIEDYTINKLSDDIAGLIEAFGETSAIVIGHDWGGAVAWHLAASKPEYVKKLIAINIPHPTAMPRVFMKNPLQWLKSSYMAFFQLPEVPEKLMAANDFESMKQAMKGTARPDAFTDQELERYKDAWSQPGALTGMLNWYRAIRKGSLLQMPKAPLRMPVRIIWGLGDQFLSPMLATESLKFCENAELVWVGEATHWVHHEQPEIVNRLIKEFLA
ncbi:MULTISPECIES: alpha/beta fold hydrolase [unclassified Planococcus (in: firmicutes)]|uniref:alpha/beta fold hydrolase n=1 Tax=unclassified Planococcus (in: firmicutes) TaxID=2662419 RepID=UPI000C33FE10|nr:MULTISPECIES: alpha/beta hydrolase [unclassified Planococcus (in: firmicutes)]AUD12526.1 alpha/beta hydrolase [Planococcus sp. MB-3u-03]PKG44375.1 alpha/beta hydrolase [Planococcus sp. Urea-trap-24]PKG90876.1 alpha/beta hydrolase [Planococcus sp. Urea-3u-39]PKH38402.1 alpha/beta hydrolase [Planococcus sp. MB-3u-09]